MRKLLPLISLIAMAGCRTTPMKTHEIPVIKLTKIQELHLEKPLDKGRPAFISAASGLSKVDDTFYTVSDDEMSLFSFKEGDKYMKVHPLIKKSLSAANIERKKEKADFESFVHLDETQWPPMGAMLAWPSGSTPKRTVAVILAFKSPTEFEAPREINIMPLAMKLTEHATELNIEGIMIQENNVLLFQRGNSLRSKSGIFELPLAQFISALKTGDWEMKTKFRKVKVGELSGVKLTLADGVSTGHGLLAIATAEDTVSTYADGKVYGTVLLRVTANESQILAHFEPVVKLEGMTVIEDTADGVTLMFVDDADDPKKPSSLYKASITKELLNVLNPIE